MLHRPSESNIELLFLPSPCLDIIHQGSNGRLQSFIESATKKTISLILPSKSGYSKFPKQCNKSMVYVVFPTYFLSNYHLNFIIGSQLIDIHLRRMNKLKSQLFFILFTILLVRKIQKALLMLFFFQRFFVC